MENLTYPNKKTKSQTSFYQYLNTGKPTSQYNLKSNTNKEYPEIAASK